jgi:hypothetical protein
LSDFVRLYRGLVTPEVCRDIIARFDTSPRRYAGRVIGYAGLKRCSELAIAPQLTPDWPASINEALNKAVGDAFRSYVVDVPSFRYMDPVVRNNAVSTAHQLQRYEPGAKTFDDGGEGFGWHIDAGMLVSCTRYLAVIVYLNTVEDGGETEFQVQGLKIKPDKGAVLLFPPTFEYPHRGCTPRSGPKYIATSFFVHPMPAHSHGPGMPPHVH